LFRNSPSSYVHGAFRTLDRNTSWTGCLVQSPIMQNLRAYAYTSEATGTRAINSAGIFICQATRPFDLTLLLKTVDWMGQFKARVIKTTLAACSAAHLVGQPGISVSTVIDYRRKWRPCGHSVSHIIADRHFSTKPILGIARATPHRIYIERNSTAGWDHMHSSYWLCSIYWAVLRMRMSGELPIQLASPS